MKHGVGARQRESSQKKKEIMNEGQYLVSLLEIRLHWFTAAPPFARGYIKALCFQHPTLRASSALSLSPSAGHCI